MVRKITGWELTDVRSGYMGFRSDLIPNVSRDIIVEGYGIPMELLLRVWWHKPHAVVCDIPHTAMYNRGISRKLHQKYSQEDHCYSLKSDRLQVAYEALLQIVTDMGIPRERILEMNGFLNYEPAIAQS